MHQLNAFHLFFHTRDEYGLILYMRLVTAANVLSHFVFLILCTEVVVSSW